MVVRNRACACALPAMRFLMRIISTGATVGTGPTVGAAVAGRGLFLTGSGERRRGEGGGDLRLGGGLRFLGGGFLGGGRLRLDEDGAASAASKGARHKKRIARTNDVH